MTGNPAGIKEACALKLSERLSLYVTLPTSERPSLYAAPTYARNANPIAYLGGNHVNQNKKITE